MIGTPANIQEDGGFVRVGGGGGIVIFGIVISYALGVVRGGVGVGVGMTVRISHFEVGGSVGGGIG